MPYATVSYTGDGVIKQFAVPFSYINESYVKVHVNGFNTPFSFVNAGLVELGSPPANGAEVRVFRSTELAQKLVDYEDNSLLTADQLDLSSSQFLHLIQEANDNLASGGFTPPEVPVYPTVWWANSADYTSLSGFISMIGTTKSVLVVNSALPLGNTSVTVPETVELQFLLSGSLVGPGTLTINGPITANRQQIFDANTTVVFGPVSTAAPLVEWWGAKADSTGVHSSGTDNTAAIIRAISSCSKSKRPLKLSSGIYRCGSSVTYTSASSSEEMVIKGEGMGVSTLWMDFDTGVAALELVGSLDTNKLSLQDLTLGRYNTGVLREGKLLRLSYLKWFDVSRVEFYGSSGFTTSLVTCKHGVITNCIVRDTVNLTGCDGFHIGDGSHFITISDNKISKTGDDSIAIGGHFSGEVTHIVIDGNTIEDTGTNGIKLMEGAQYCVISNNTIRAAKLSGIIALTANFGTSTIHDNLIVGNTIVGCGQLGPHGGVLISRETAGAADIFRIQIIDNVAAGCAFGATIYGCAGYNVTGVTLKNNTFTDCSRSTGNCQGIYVTYGRDTTIEGNIIHYTDEQGIKCEYCSGKLFIRHNTVYGWGAKVPTLQGILIRVPLSDIRVNMSFNYVERTTQTGYHYYAYGCPSNSYFFHNALNIASTTELSATVLPGTHQPTTYKEDWINYGA